MAETYSVAEAAADSHLAQQDDLTIGAHRPQTNLGANLSKGRFGRGLLGRGRAGSPAEARALLEPQPG